MPRNFDLENRLIDFSVAIIHLGRKLPNDYVGKHLAHQLFRSGTSPALNYGEAQAAESRADFIHKMKICLKELRETEVCLKIIGKVPLTPQAELAPILKECGELVAIFTKSVGTAKRNKAM